VDQRGPLSVLQRFFATAPELATPPGAVKAGHLVGDLPPGSARSWPFSKEALQATLSRYGCKIESLIVTVPDPIDSPFGFEFDQMIDVIQRALARSADYVLDRTWLPWEEDRKTVSPKGKILGGRRRKSPGALLFRSAKERRLCVAFLVGETPTTGIHKLALAEALELISCYDQTKREFRIVGPYFTGSETSLQMVVETQRSAALSSLASVAGLLASPGVWARLQWSSGLLQVSPYVKFNRVNGSATGVEPKADGEAASDALPFNML
jgi:hypothetical protein